MENGSQKRQPETESPRIYVACLSSYNSGILHGAWIDADQEPAGIHAEIQAMLAKSREPVAEEWAIHDHDGFHGYRVSEYESIENVVEIAQLIAEHGHLGAELIGHCGSVTDAREALDDNYQGAFDSPTAWAEQLLEDTGALAAMPENLRGYFDFESYTRDADLSGDIFVLECGGQHHIFWSR